MNNKMVLICDDDEGVLDMLEMILANSGFEIVPVKNSLIIYDIIRQKRPDFILLDLWMPVLSGGYRLLANSCFKVSQLENTSGRYVCLFFLAASMSLFSSSKASQRYLILASCTAS
jgi:PleD family two-component response regulator